MFIMEISQKCLLAKICGVRELIRCIVMKTKIQNFAFQSHAVLAAKYNLWTRFVINQIKSKKLRFSAPFAKSLLPFAANQAHTIC